MKKEAEFHIGDGQHLTMKTTHSVQMKDRLKLITGGGKGVELDIEITADFEKIPEQYHQLFMQMMCVRYGGMVNVYDNTSPFKESTVSKKKWYQFWKSN